MTTASMEAFITQCFNDNLKALERESGHQLAPEPRRAALEQVLFYWRKLRHVAEGVTDTEVELNLPDQHTPGDGTFGIEGVVDIVREGDRVVMYDIKTHDVEQVRAQPDLYARQLNIYAHIWQTLRGQRLDETAIICTALPRSLQRALRSRDARRIAVELQAWSPVITLTFDRQAVKAAIAEFAETVDAIEAHDFAPPPWPELKEHRPGAHGIFASSVCINCDGRFSCEAYRTYALQGQDRAARQFQKYYAPLFDDMSDQEASEDWINAGLETMSLFPNPD
jgi:hypothetical protein